MGGWVGGWGEVGVGVGGLWKPSQEVSLRRDRHRASLPRRRPRAEGRRHQPAGARPPEKPSGTGQSARGALGPPPHALPLPLFLAGWLPCSRSSSSVAAGVLRRHRRSVVSGLQPKPMMTACAVMITKNSEPSPERWTWSPSPSAFRQKTMPSAFPSVVWTRSWRG